MDVKKHQLDPNPRIIQNDNSDDDLYLSIKIGNGQIGVLTAWIIRYPGIKTTWMFSI